VLRRTPSSARSLRGCSSSPSRASARSARSARARLVSPSTRMRPRAPAPSSCPGPTSEDTPLYFPAGSLAFLCPSIGVRWTRPCRELGLLRPRLDSFRRLFVCRGDIGPCRAVGYHPCVQYRIVRVGIEVYSHPIVNVRVLGDEPEEIGSVISVMAWRNDIFDRNVNRLMYTVCNTRLSRADRHTPRHLHELASPLAD
jgi:hypothetical protein